MGRTSSAQQPSDAAELESLDVSPEPSDATAQPSEVESSQATPLTVVDEYHGHGGTYLLDPATGVRTRISN